MEAEDWESGCIQDFVSVTHFPTGVGHLPSEVPICPGIRNFFGFMTVDSECWGRGEGIGGGLRLGPTRPFSTSRVVMTMTRVFSCHVICQKSLTVASRQPWLAMYVLAFSSGPSSWFWKQVQRDAHQDCEALGARRGLCPTPLAHPSLASASPTHLWTRYHPETGNPQRPASPPMWPATDTNLDVVGVDVVGPRDIAVTSLQDHSAVVN